MTTAAQQLFAAVRAATIPTSEHFRRALELRIPYGLIWAAAGAGLAACHLAAGQTIDIAAEIGGIAPQEYLDGYAGELRQNELARQIAAL